MAKTSPAFFGQNLSINGLTNPAHYPSIPFGSLRLWDTHTHWKDIEAVQGQFDWNILDRWLALAKAQNKEVLYAFGKLPQWASSNPNAPGPACTGCAAPPKDVDTTDQMWKDFVSAVVQHCLGQVSAYEVWNEPDGGFWTGTPSQMARMAKDAYAIIHTLDSAARVVSPGISSFTPGPGRGHDWLTKYAAAGGLDADACDIIGFHEYPQQPSNPSAAYILPQIDALKTLAGTREIWSTEGSWNGSGPSPLSLDGQAAWLAEQHLFLWSKGVARNVWFTWDSSTYGTLWDATNGIHPAGVLLGQLYDWLVGAELTQPATQASDGTWTIGLTLASGQAATISWKSGSKPILTTQGGTVGSKTLSFPVPAVPVVFTDQTSKGVNLTQNGDAVTITDSAVVPPVVTKVSVSGPSSVPQNGTAQYTAVVQGQGAYNPAVVWSCLFGTIDQTGKYIAPAKIEVDTVSAQSVQTPAVGDSHPVSITGTSGRTQVFPSGNNDSAQVVAAAAKGPIQLSAGPNGSTFRFSASTALPPGFDILGDDGVVLSDVAGYGNYDRMLLVGGAGGKFAGSGGPNAVLITMPNCYAKNIGNSNQDVNQYNHGLTIDGGSGVAVSGVRFTKCGGDGFYITNARNVSFANCDSRNNIRNPWSATDNIDGVAITNCFGGFCNNANAGIGANDVEPNPTGKAGPCVIKIIGCQFMHNTGTSFSNGLRLSIENLSPNAKVDIEVSNCQASGNSSGNYHCTVANKPSGWKVYGHGNLDEGQPTNFPN
jgi:hypothetical protein